MSEGLGGLTSETLALFLTLNITNPNRKGRTLYLNFVGRPGTDIPVVPM